MRLVTKHNAYIFGLPLSFKTVIIFSVLQVGDTLHVSPVVWADTVVTPLLMTSVLLLRAYNMNLYNVSGSSAVMVTCCCVLSSAVIVLP